MVTCDLTERMLAARSDGRHLAAQQHLVADHDRGDDAGIFLGQAHHRRDLREVLQPVAAEPDPLNDLQPDLGGECRNLIEAVVDRIGAHAVGYLGELRQILGDLFRAICVVGTSGVWSPRNGA